MFSSELSLILLDFGNVAVKFVIYKYCKFGGYYIETVTTFLIVSRIYVVSLTVRRYINQETYNTMTQIPFQAPTSIPN